jgi:hypothetical protein
VDACVLACDGSVAVEGAGAAQVDYPHALLDIEHPDVAILLSYAEQFRQSLVAAAAGAPVGVFGITSPASLEKRPPGAVKLVVCPDLRLAELGIGEAAERACRPRVATDPGLAWRADVDGPVVVAVVDTRRVLQEERRCAAVWAVGWRSLGRRVGGRGFHEKGFSVDVLVSRQIRRMGSITPTRPFSDRPRPAGREREGARLHSQAARRVQSGSHWSSHCSGGAWRRARRR